MQRSSGIQATYDRPCRPRMGPSTYSFYFFLKMTAAIGEEIEKGMKVVTRGVDNQARNRYCTERVFVISRFFCGLQIGDGHSNGCR